MIFNSHMISLTLYLNKLVIIVVPEDISNETILNVD